MKRIIWSILLVGTAYTLVLGFIKHDWVLTIISMIMCAVLTYFNKIVDVPEFYKAHGITNEKFMNNRKIKSGKI
jgi:hypothetical protein